MNNYKSLLLIVLAGFFIMGPAAAQSISASDAYEAARAGRILLVDIRTPAEWQQTRVPEGAVLIGVAHPQGPAGFMQALLEKVGGDKTAPIALICRTGNRTGQVLRYLRAQGFTHTVHVAEGMAGSAAGPGWLARRLPTEACGVC